MTTIHWVLPLCVFLVFAVVLSRIDIERHVLPNRLVALGLVSVLGTEFLMTLLACDASQIQQSLTKAGQTLLVYAFLFIVSRGRLGMGDVKFSALTGLVIGWTAPNLWLGSIWLAFTLAAVWVLTTQRRGLIDRHSHIAFGPFMSVAVLLCALFNAPNF